MMAKMGVPRLVIGKILNHIEPGVTKVYDRYSYDKEKQEALNAWGARLAAILDTRQDNAQTAIREADTVADLASGSKKLRKQPQSDIIVQKS